MAFSTNLADRKAFAATLSAASGALRRVAALGLVAALAACALPNRHVPAFAARHYEPFNRADTIAIALREWRLFGAPVDDDLSEAPPKPEPRAKPERMAGLWQRVGEYWWIGQDPDDATVGWTGKHDAQGRVFPPDIDGRYAWSAAFISYVMRIAGAGPRFPYSPNHATYVNAAAAGRSPVLKARRVESYMPQPGDLICRGRKSARSLKFDDLPTASTWPGHCGLVVEAAPGLLSIIGGNVSDAVALSHVPVTAAGMLAGPDGVIIDRQHAWFVVLQVLYDAEGEPDVDR